MNALGTVLACFESALLLPREHQRFVPKLGRVAATVGPPNVRSYSKQPGLFSSASSELTTCATEIKPVAQLSTTECLILREF
jgi:hypothetical protein